MSVPWAADLHSMACPVPPPKCRELFRFRWPRLSPCFHLVPPTSSSSCISPFRKWELSFQLPLGQKPRLPLACSPLSYLCSVLPPTLLALLSDHICSLTTSHGLHCSQPLPSLRAFLQGTGSCCPRCSCSHYTPRSSQSDPFKTEAVSRPVSARKSANSLKVKPMSI